ncbi:MAG: hypothetical protein A3E07_03690 [Candidatus Wildermuthbacteria bacterium RIFCSPHIGHO2_12_FULL_45_9]|uniref:Uncharacterized protein n=1 Tax=Candidatus Wildermuthbacteria bacterium RIFCSPHIGHO2_02_FULL_45_25 TaxID=1802450 RepID=A0A1G2R389_9BACT|nr:MAG: hypothetical protein A3C04_03475 [Candidatus Wildermuthbacteria bacterium RIFCSPHIGHO2_02_FULL_45_25]OHA72424.1 MAG: hypothetical protein A3E07_03690 [Candidatus Wildermuthbacteria bacterium RIFCSPHIGHO2_12_FULL_45_9]
MSTGVLMPQTTPIAFATEIMGQNFYGPDERFGAGSPDDFVPIPFAPNFLQRHQSDHALIFIPAISSADMIRRFPQYFMDLSHRPCQYAQEPFARSWGHARWHLIALNPLPGSTDKTWHEQVVLLKQGATVPSARSLAFLALAHYLRTRKVLFEDNPGRSSSTVIITNERHHIAVRCFQDANSPLSIVFMPRPDSMRLALTSIAQEFTG